MIATASLVELSALIASLTGLISAIGVIVTASLGKKVKTKVENGIETKLEEVHEEVKNNKHG